LSTSKDWRDWFDGIRLKATTREIWSYVNPDTPESDLPELTFPPRIIPQSVKPSTKSIEDLKEAEKDELKQLRWERKRDITEYNARKKALADLHILITDTVTNLNRVYIRDLDSVHTILVKLKERFAPRAEIRERDLIEAWKRLHKVPKNMSFDEWLMQWDNVYAECKKIDLPDVQGKRAVLTFLSVVETIDQSSLRHGSSRSTNPQINTTTFTNLLMNSDAGTTTEGTSKKGKRTWLSPPRRGSQTMKKIRGGNQHPCLRHRSQKRKGMHLWQKSSI
jgi:hypothetical protein